MSTHGSMSTQGSRPDPLTDIVLCPTTRRPPPEPAIGVSVARRSRAAIIDGARAAVTAHGSTLTMAQIAARAGVSKATLYNHFRTREDVLGELLLAEIDDLVSAVSHLRLAEALTRAARAISEHPLLEALGEQDGGALTALARVDVRSAGWARAAQATERLLREHGRRGTPTVLRWLASLVTAPADDRDIAADVEVLVAGLPPAR
ncbi:MAG: TetR/AcrR family transcriptional regulator [Jatrophihabitans sp.]